MAKGRMLHNKISKSIQVDRLPLPARLLFTWMISWADDEGRLKGDPKYIKATVVPLTNWPIKKIEQYIHLLKKEGLIYYWLENEEWVIEFIKWNQHQVIRKDRFITSDLPSFNKTFDNQRTTNWQPGENQVEPQSNGIEGKEIKEKVNEINKSEYNTLESIADNSSFKRIGLIINPSDFKPQNEGEVAAWDAWRKLEPNNKFAFKSTYMRYLSQGLPPSKFYQFISEIQQDPTVRNPGAVFNKKAGDYLEIIVEPTQEDDDVLP